MTLISASLLSCRDNLKEITKDFNNLDIDYIHLDIMDGKFVPYNSFTDDEIKIISDNTNKPFDVHLMVNDPLKYISKYANLNTSYITIHYEAITDLKIFDVIKSYGIKVGISIKPNTEVDEIFDLLPLVDLVLVMSVEPGRGGQEFIKSTLDKINKLSKKIKSLNLDVLISVDGGINNNNSNECKINGVKMLVIGSALANSNDKNLFISQCKNNINTMNIN